MSKESKHTTSATHLKTRKSIWEEQRTKETVTKWKKMSYIMPIVRHYLLIIILNVNDLNQKK